jgi:hypothetical protein
VLASITIGAVPAHDGGKCGFVPVRREHGMAILVRQVIHGRSELPHSGDKKWTDD